jgi:hypothetical protein
VRPLTGFLWLAARAMIAAMPQAEQISATFPVARCAACAKTVLTCVVLDDDGCEVRVCAHCDAPVQSDLEWIDAEELEATGYVIGKRPRPHAGGCSSGGCGSGACGRKN